MPAPAMRAFAAEYAPAGSPRPARPRCRRSPARASVRQEQFLGRALGRRRCPPGRASTWRGAIQFRPSARGEHRQERDGRCCARDCGVEATAAAAATSRAPSVGAAPDRRLAPYAHRWSASASLQSTATVKAPASTPGRAVEGPDIPPARRRRRVGRWRRGHCRATCQRPDGHAVLGDRARLVHADDGRGAEALHHGQAPYRARVAPHIRRMPSARVVVATVGSPSGTAATARDGHAPEHGQRGPACSRIPTTNRPPHRVAASDGERGRPSPPGPARRSSGVGGASTVSLDQRADAAQLRAPGLST